VIRLRRPERLPTSAFPIGLLVFLIGLLILIQPRLLLPINLSAKSDSALTFLLLAAGETLPILTGGIDLSIGGVENLVNSTAATQMSETNWIALSIILLTFGLIAGAINGLLVVRLRVNPFVATLATWSIWSGAALLIAPVDGGQATGGLTSFMRMGDLPIPGSLVIALLIWVAWLWFRRTNAGFELFGIGSSRHSAELSGVRTGRHIIAAYAVCGMLAALAGLYRTVQIGSGSPIAGNNLILPSVAAVVIGGTSLAGGRGGVGMSMVGALILLVVSDLLFFAGVDPFLTPLLQGLVLIGAVTFSAIGERLPWASLGRPTRKAVGE
jgi:ribose transport system permease protein